MTEKYMNPIKKKVRKIKRVLAPKTIGDYMDNLTIDLKNYSVQIKNIRKKLGKGSRYIRSVRGIGYKIEE